MGDRRPACSTGYLCHDPRTGTGCGQWFDRDPAGTDSWWFPCPACGTIVGPALESEVPDRLFPLA